MSVRMFEPKDVMLSTKSMVTRFVVIAVITTFAFWLLASSRMQASVSPWWAWTGHAGSWSAAFTRPLPILVIVLGATVVAGIVRIKSGRSTSIVSFDSHVVRFAVYEELMRWPLWLLWLTLVERYQLLQHMLAPVVDIAGVATFGFLGNHVGSHSVIFAGAAILASVRLTRGPESTQWWSRITGTYIGVMTFSLVFTFGIIYSTMFRLALYLLMYFIKLYLRRFSAPTN